MSRSLDVHTALKSWTKLSAFDCIGPLRVRHGNAKRADLTDSAQRLNGAIHARHGVTAWSLTDNERTDLAERLAVVQQDIIDAGWRKPGHKTWAVIHYELAAIKTAGEDYHGRNTTPAVSAPAQQTQHAQTFPLSQPEIEERSRVQRLRSLFRRQT